MINQGEIDEALTELSAIPDGSNDAEWNFLMGSAYYYKGWLAQALRYFQIACHLAPGNREYEAALRNLQNSADGAMPGNPYGNQPYGAQAIGCTCCDMCAAMACMDMCCNCGGGGCM
jgi:tetratricopeptide (TPR) repeat protein